MSRSHPENGAFIPILLAGVTIVGFALRCYRLEGNLYSDEVWILSTAVSPMGAFLQEIAQDWVHPPLFHFIAREWVGIFGANDLSARMIAVAFGTLSVPLIYWIGKEAAGPKTGLAASVLLALSPVHIFHSQYGRHYSMFVFFTLLSIACFMKSYRRPESRKYSACYAASSVLLVYTHYFGWLVIFCQLLFLIARKAPSTKHWVAAQAIIYASYVPWVIFVMRNMDRPETGRSFLPLFDWIQSPTLRDPLNTLIAFNGTLPFSHQGKIGLLLFGIIVLISVVKILSGDMKIRENPLFLLSCLVLPFVLVYAVSKAVKPIWLTRAMLVSLPSYYLLIAFGCVHEKKSAMRNMLFALPLLWVAASSYFYLKSDHRMPFQNIASYLERESEDAMPIYVENTYLMNPIFHYYKGKGILLELKENNVSVVPERNKGNLKSLPPAGALVPELFILVTYSDAERMYRKDITRVFRLDRQEAFSGRGEEGQPRTVKISFYKHQPAAS